MICRLTVVVAAACLGCASDLGTYGETPEETTSPTPTEEPTSDPIATDGIFVSSQAYTAEEIQTPLGADSLCSSLAADGEFLAWIGGPGTVGETALERAQDQLSGGGPWARMDGVRVFEDVNSITAGPEVPIAIDETGADLGGVDVWTGTEPDGSLHDDHCENWLENGVQGRYGRSDETGDGWTSSASGDCATPRHLYCLAKP